MHRKRRGLALLSSRLWRVIVLLTLSAVVFFSVQLIERLAQVSSESKLQQQLVTILARAGSGNWPWEAWCTLPLPGPGAICQEALHPTTGSHTACCL